MKIRGLTVAALGGALSAPSIASAHINLIDPPSRYGEPYVKEAPCGHPANPLEGEITEYMAGETITIVVDEFIGHNGHLRVAFAENDSDIVGVSAFDDFDNFPGVLLDNVIDAAGEEPTFNLEITLPDMACEDCTLQVIQVMYDGDGFQANDLYHTCARVTLVEQGGGSDDATTGPADTGDDVGDTGVDTTGGADDSADEATDGADDGDGGGDDAADGADDGADDAADDAGSGSSGTGTNADGGSGDDDGGGCGCRSSSGPPPAALLLLMLVALRRRR